MAAVVTFALIGATRHRVKYLVTADGAAAGNLDAAGGATPDLSTDTVVNGGNGSTSPIHNLLTNGGAQLADQAAARTLMRGTGASVRFSPGGTLLSDWILDYNVTAAPGNLRITCTCAAVAGDAVGAVLEIESVHDVVR